MTYRFIYAGMMFFSIMMLGLVRVLAAFHYNRVSAVRTRPVHFMALVTCAAWLWAVAILTVMR